MTGVGSLSRFVRQMLPIKLRGSRSFKTLIEALSGRIDAEVSQGQERVIALLEELRYTGSVQSIREIVDLRFGGSVSLIDANQNGNLVLVSADNEEYRGFARGVNDDERFIAVSNAMTDVGYGFTVVVSDGVDVGEVDGFIRRFVFLGVNYKIVER